MNELDSFIQRAPSRNRHS